MPMATLSANNTLSDASFSPYFNGAEQKFVLQLSKSPHNSFSMPHNGHIPLGINKSEYEELDVFSAERYFNEQLEEQEVTKGILNKKDDADALDSLKRNTRPATPSLQSESSWNSRSLLLNIPTPQQKQKGISSWRKSLLASLGCNCSCNDDNAVDVGNHARQREAKKGKNNGHLNQFGNTNSHIGIEDKGEFDKRRSVDVFGSPLKIICDKPSSLEREVKLLAWDAIPSRGLEKETKKCPNGEYNDTNSESSSDLFEIESFSTGYTNPYLVRQSSGVRSGCITPTTCYAPSEASVQWSTVTASMADFSVMSDSEEFDTVPARTSHSRKVRDERNTQRSKQMTNKSSGILSSCKSHKTVRVAREAHRTTDKAYLDLQRQQGMQTIQQTRRFQTENKLTGLKATNNHRFNTLPLS